MTFNEWAKDRPCMEPHTMSRLMAQAAWDAAVEAEREACALQLEGAADAIIPPGQRRSNEADRHTVFVLRGHAKAIRARSEK